MDNSLENGPSSLTETLVAGTLVSAGGIPATVRMPSSPDSTPTIRTPIGTLRPSAFAQAAESAPATVRSSRTRLAFVRGIATGVAMTSLALLAVALVVSAPSSWRSSAPELRPVAMHLVERLAARRSEAAPAPKAEPAPKPARSSRPRAHTERLARERRAPIPASHILERAL